MTDTGIFATARRGHDNHTLTEARKLLRRGYGYQNTARIVGVNELTLRELCGAPPPRPERTRPIATDRTRARREEPIPQTPGDLTRSIISRVCRRYGISAQEIMGRSQARRLAWPRQEAMAMLWGVRGHNHTSIGAVFNRDHSTVCTSIQRYEERAAWADVLSVFAGFNQQPDLFAPQAMRDAA